MARRSVWATSRASVSATSRSRQYRCRSCFISQARKGSVEAGSGTRTMGIARCSGGRSSSSYQRRSSKPAAAASSLVAQWTTRSTRAHMAAARHMGHGSQLEYSVHPRSAKVPAARHARRIATTSACAVGSRCGTTRFTPVASGRPSRMTTAPNGPPPSPTLAHASRTASDRYSDSCASECAFIVILRPLLIADNVYSSGRWPEL